LQHGDIMVMHGRQIQELYEVSTFSHQIQAWCKLICHSIPSYLVGNCVSH
jgi:hypothetical protein